MIFFFIKVKSKTFELSLVRTTKGNISRKKTLTKRLTWHFVWPIGVRVYKQTSFSLFSVTEVFRRTREIYGGVDLVVNNAGIMDETHWEKCIDVNVVMSA